MNREPLTIICTLFHAERLIVLNVDPENGTYMAMRADDAKDNATGQTPEEAIGSLIMKLYEEKGN